MAQTVTSKDTANPQIAATFKVRSKFDFSNTVVLDYGCGKGKGKKYLEENYSGCQAFNYDPFHDFDEMEGFANADGKKIIACNNVLNVIKDDLGESILGNIHAVASRNDVTEIIFKIYPGDKTGVGRETKPDCWQRNMETVLYIPEVKAAFPEWKEDHFGQYIVLSRK